MAGNRQEILDLIPHRPPFLWVDSILELNGEILTTTTTIPDDLELFRGHYPGNPIVPGVLICEAVFQSGALLIAKLIGKTDELKTNVPVLSRITGCRFKRQVLPGDTLVIRVELKERLASAWFIKGVARVNGKVAVQVTFSCTLVPQPTSVELP